MQILHRIGCLFGRHHRGPRSEVRNLDGELRSKCRGCGAAMVRDFSGWRLESARPAGD